MNISRWLCLSIFTSFCSYGQSDIDSIKNILNSERAQGHNINVAYQLYQLGYRFEIARQYDSALWYYQQVLKIGGRPADSAAASNGIGIIYTNIGLPDRSIPHYLQAISLYERLQDTTNAVTTINNLAIIYKDQGLYDEALEISFNSLPRLEKQKPSRTLGSAYNTIGTVYTRIQDYQKAYEYYRKALAVRVTIKHDQGIGSSYNNIGDLFIEMTKYDSALTNLSKAVEIRRKINDVRGVGRTMTLIGSTLVRAGRAEEAKKQLMEALTMNRTSTDNNGEIATLNTLATAYIATNELRAAEENLKLARKLIRQGNVKEQLRNNLELQAKVYRSLNDRQKLVDALDELIIVKDSLLNAEKVESMLALEIQYETEKKEQEIVVLRQQQQLDTAELDKNRIQIYSLIGGLLFLIVIATLLYRLYRVKEKEKLVADLHTKEIHHRVKNNLQILSSIFTIQAAMVDDRKAQEIIASTQGRVNAMALVHKKLYMSDESQEVDLGEYVHDLANSLAFSYDFNRDNLQVEVDHVQISFDKTIRTLLIMNELITNSLKYACSDNPGARLRVAVHRGGNSMLIEIADNGKKLKSIPEIENSTSFGLKMVRSLVKGLGGQMAITIENGAKFSITIPLP